MFKLKNYLRYQDSSLVFLCKLQKNHFSSYLKELHIYPLISSIWSANQRDISNFPLKLFLNFFNNHDLFNFKDRPQWKFVQGGSNTYIKKIIDLDKFSFSLNTKIDKIFRSENNIKIETDFIGKEVIIFGILNDDHETIMTIKGPEKNALIQKKERILGFWFNTKQITYNQIPSIFFISSYKSKTLKPS